MNRSCAFSFALGVQELRGACCLAGLLALSAGCAPDDASNAGALNSGGTPADGTGGLGSAGLRGGAASGGALFGAAHGGSAGGAAAAGGGATGTAPSGGTGAANAAAGGSSAPASGGAAGTAPVADSDGGASAGGAAVTGPLAGAPASGGSGGDASIQPPAGGAAGAPAANGGAGANDPAPSDGTCVPPLPGSKGMNPLFSDIFTADPAPLVHDCTFYIVAGHDQGTTGFDLREWYVLSSKDMVNWSSNGGPIMGLDTFKWANANAWAGQMVARDGKFYWYVPINESRGGMTIAVAVADSPLGPFKDALGKPLVNDASEMANFNFNDPGQTVYTIDPTVFVDDDEQAYLLYGGFSRLVLAKLGKDMISIEGKMVESTPRGFFEAPFLTKREGTYYLVYAAGINPAAVDYVTAKSPTGPWSTPKRILDPLPNLPGQHAATSHPGIAEFAGQWYLTYHLSNGPGGGTYRRQVAVEKLTFKADGSIEKVTPSPGLSF